MEAHYASDYILTAKSPKTKSKLPFSELLPVRNPSSPLHQLAKDPATATSRGIPLSSISVEPVRYRPADAIQWLEFGAQERREGAKKKGVDLVRREGHRTIGKDLKQVAGAIVELGKSALAGMAHRRAQGTEYVLRDNVLEVVRAGSIESIPYDDVERIEQRGDKVQIHYRDRALTIKPQAYIVAGRIKAPVGWSRNGIEVPFAVLPDEIAARCRLDVVTLS
jgi:hypothetical protein